MIVDLQCVFLTNFTKRCRIGVDSFAWPWPFKCSASFSPGGCNCLQRTIVAQAIASNLNQFNSLRFSERHCVQLKGFCKHTTLLAQSVALIGQLGIWSNLRCVPPHGGSGLPLCNPRCRKADILGLNDGKVIFFAMFCFTLNSSQWRVPCSFCFVLWFVWCFCFVSVLVWCLVAGNLSSLQWLTFAFFAIAGSRTRATSVV